MRQYRSGLVLLRYSDGVSGSAVAQYPSAASLQILQQAIELKVTVNSPAMTAACRERYKQALATDLKELSRLVNLLICNGSMCSYVSGSPGSGVSVNQSSVLNQHYVFTAIDTASLTNAVTFDVAASVCVSNFCTYVFPDLGIGLLLAC